MLLCIYMHRECGSTCHGDAIVRLPGSKACTTNAITISITTTIQKLSPTPIALSSNYRIPAARQKQYQDHTNSRPIPDQDHTKARARPGPIPIPDQLRARTWANPGPAHDQPRTRPRPTQDQTRASPEPDQDQDQPRTNPDQGQPRTSPDQSRARPGPSEGQAKADRPKTSILGLKHCDLRGFLAIDVHFDL